MYTIKERLEIDYGITRLPNYFADRCSARKSRGDNCTVCAEICPQGIYPLGKRKRPVWDSCIRCGLCAAACPDRCLTAPADRVNAFLMACGKRGVVSIGCEREESYYQLRVSCVAAVSWEQLAIAALKNGVAIWLRGCDSCPREKEKELIRDNLERLKDFLGAERFSRQVKLLREGDSLPQDMGEAVSRREMLRFVGNLPLDRAFAMLPQLEDQRQSGLFYRAILRDMAKNAAEDDPQGEKFGMVLPKFSGNCYNCGYCAKACPNEALKILPGESTFTVAVDAWKCTGCGICRNTCRVEGITALAQVKLRHLGTVGLIRLGHHSCSRCGAPFPRSEPGALCAACQVKEQTEALRRRRMGGGHEE